MGSNSDAYIKEAYRILKSMGFILIAEPKKKWLGRVDELNEIINECGFTQAAITESEQFIYSQSFKV